ncbi:putative serum response factor-like isoform X3 [Penaeus vannamei]|uniref:Putative serum response factor-like isoform X3 n=1 Tax=Penaeus vannamei TaxID=6689 RepID=A0A423SM52_PENVA|nr:putative serum response factor-like isoform X3 [Penaeus vannamei]
MLLVASETGHVYTFATRKLQPMITSEAGKALIQTCLNSPDPPQVSSHQHDQRMSATGYEETELTYAVNEDEHKPGLAPATTRPTPPTATTRGRPAPAPPPGGPADAPALPLPPCPHSPMGAPSPTSALPQRPPPPAPHIPTHSR